MIASKDGVYFEETTDTAIIKDPSRRTENWLGRSGFLIMPLKFVSIGFLFLVVDVQSPTVPNITGHSRYLCFCPFPVCPVLGSNYPGFFAQKINKSFIACMHNLTLFSHFSPPNILRDDLIMYFLSYDVHVF